MAGNIGNKNTDVTEQTVTDTSQTTPELEKIPEDNIDYDNGKIEEGIQDDIKTPSLNDKPEIEMQGKYTQPVWEAIHLNGGYITYFRDDESLDDGRPCYYSQPFRLYLLKRSMYWLLFLLS